MNKKRFNGAGAKRATSAAYSETFIEKIKRRLEKIKKQGPKLLSGPDHALNEGHSTYGEWDNKLEWEIESNKGNDICQL